MVAAAIIVGCGLSVWASAYGVKLELNNFTKSMFYYLFMYGVGLRVGPSFVNSLGGDGLKFTLLAIISSVVGLVLVVLGRAVHGASAGCGGRHAGRVTDHVRGHRLGRGGGERRRAHAAAGHQAEQVSSMIALSYGITYIWGTVGIILITKYLPKWWGIDAEGGCQRVREEARRGERRPAARSAAGPRRPARLPAGEQAMDRQDHRRHAARQNPSTGSSTSCAAGDPRAGVPGPASLQQTTSSRWAAAARR